jgi:hypothetical protein
MPNHIVHVLPQQLALEIHNHNRYHPRDRDHCHPHGHDHYPLTTTATLTTTRPLGLTLTLDHDHCHPRGNDRCHPATMTAAHLNLAPLFTRGNFGSDPVRGLAQRLPAKCVLFDLIAREHMGEAALLHLFDETRQAGVSQRLLQNRVEELTSHRVP